MWLLFLERVCLIVAPAVSWMVLECRLVTLQGGALRVRTGSRCGCRAGPDS